MLMKTLRLNSSIESCLDFSMVSFTMRALLIAFILVPSQLVNATEGSSADLLKDAIGKRKTGHYHQAIGILEKLQRQHSEHKRINIELAINHIKLKQYSEAEVILLHLQGLPLTEQESKKLSALQRLIDKKANINDSRYRFSADASFYLGVDNFLSLFPDWSNTGTIYCYDYFDGDEYLFTECYDENNNEVEDIDFEEQDNRETVTERDQQTYTSQRLRFNYQYFPRQKISLFGQSAKLIWYNDLNIMQKQVRNENKSKYGQAKVDSSLYFFFPSRWIFDVRYRGIYHFSDSDKFLDEQSAQLALAVPIDKARFKFGFEFKSKFYKSHSRDKNAHVSTPWLEYSFQLTDEYKVSIGSRYYQYRAKDEIYSYDNVNFYLGLHYFPFDKFSAFATLNYHRLNYTIDDPEIVNWAQEVKRSIALGVKYQFNDSLSIGLNGHYVNKKLDMSFGHEDWNRIEAFINYRF